LTDEGNTKAESVLEGLEVSTSKDRSLSGEESKGSKNEGWNNSHIKKIKEVWENHTTNWFKGEIKGGYYKRSLVQGERRWKNQGG